MASIESDVLEAFKEQLLQDEGIPRALTEKLGALLAAEKLPKPDQLATLYTEATGESAL